MPTGTGANDLTRLCGVDDVEEDEPYRAEIDGIGYAVFFFENEYFVLEDLCSHGPGRLSDGFVEDFELFKYWYLYRLWIHQNINSVEREKNKIKN